MRSAAKDYLNFANSYKPLTIIQFTTISMGWDSWKPLRMRRELKAKNKTKKKMNPNNRTLNQLKRKETKLKRLMKKSLPSKNPSARTNEIFISYYVCLYIID